MSLTRKKTLLICISKKALYGAAHCTKYVQQKNKRMEDYALNKTKYEKMQTEDCLWRPATECYLAK